MGELATGEKAVAARQPAGPSSFDHLAKVI